jgi:hypothetical protein
MNKLLHEDPWVYHLWHNFNSTQPHMRDVLFSLSEQEFFKMTLQEFRDACEAAKVARQ